MKRLVPVSLVRFLARSISKLIVKPRLDHLDIRRQRDRVRPTRTTCKNGRIKSKRPVPQVDVVVFDLGGPVVGKGVFVAAAQKPAAVRVARAATTRRIVVSVHEVCAGPAPPVADLGVEKRAVNCKPKA